MRPVCITAHAVADLGRDPQIVRDEQKADPEALLDLGEEAENPRLDRDVEGGDRLVGRR